ncbi:MAG: bifunctional phosphoribosylaminoimidazolecarboxamide formyltransferase/IMP cyclohydrolase [Bradymonadia bacterium]|jgi:phosphoribosylaminoimidazolecarboxamide formyltransferase/IMP cyclohydrolase
MTAARRRALLSVSDKAGLVEFARALHALGYELLSTGGTRAALLDAGLEVVAVSEVTGFPEIMGGRVKTLHPRIHGGLLGRWDDADDVRAAETHGIEPIDVLCVNLYPFRETVARAGVTWSEAIEQIDIGGPAMVRAAAKNHAHVTVVTSPEDYTTVVDALRAGGPDTALRRTLAARAFAHTAAYDAAIATWMTDEPLPAHLHLVAERVEVLRYGENPHQRAAFYSLPTPPDAPSLGRARQLQGKELSYNNLLDLDAALALVLDLRPGGVAIIKHTNPCGAAERRGGESLADLYAAARATDPTSAFGGIVAFNEPVDAATGALLAETFLEAVIAPGFAPEALAALEKKKNLRLMALDPWAPATDVLEVRSVAGGLLVQSRDALVDPVDERRTVTRRAPTADELEGLDFAWRVCRHVKSNAIVYARAGVLVGVGPGQTSRVDSARIGAAKAREHGHTLEGCVVASDAFFPFADGLEVCAAAGARAFIQPGGSLRDEEVIGAADRLEAAMVFTGRRHFRH